MRTALLSSAVLFSICANAMDLPYSPVPDSVYEAEGLDPAEEQQISIASVPAGGAFDRNGWVFTADSEQAGYSRYNAMDGNSATIWHTEYNPVIHYHPHTMVINMKALKYVDGITYRPRQDGIKNGNIGQHKIYTSTDCVNYGNPAAYGTWYDDQSSKSAAFELRPARCVKIVALSEAGNRGPWTSASEFYVYGAGANEYTKPNPNLGLWGPTIDFPTVPVAGAVEPDSGNLQTWSSYAPTTFGQAAEQTLTSLWNPSTQIVTQRMVTNTQHDMFCPGTSFDANGRVVITGGDTNFKTSIYTGGDDNWSAGSQMNLARAYNAQVTIGDGRIFTIGGSWSPSRGGKNGEIYNPANNRWSLLPNCPVAPMITNDKRGVYRGDNHAMLFNWKKGYVFQAGPSKRMNWYNMLGAGGQAPAGTRGNDQDAMCGTATMYDAPNGKILTLGGAQNYDNTASTANAHVITLGTPGTNVFTSNINSMWSPRIFHNAVVLPNGEVFITGGQRVGIPFSDANSILTPEMWNPNGEKFVRMTPNRTPRNYHSIALLLTDATVASCGGGLCATCSTNHFDCQIYTPPYLLNGDGSYRARPAITYVSQRSSTPGTTIKVDTNGAVSSFSMVRYSTTTHTVNTDQRRIPMAAVKVGNNQYHVTLGPADVGVVTPGYWMLFGINSQGTPSKAYTIHIQPW